MDSGLSDELVAAGCRPGSSNLTVPLGLPNDPELLAMDCGPGTSNLTVPLGLAWSFAWGLLLGTAMGLALRLRFRDGCGVRWMQRFSIFSKYSWYKGSSCIAKTKY